MLEERLEEVQRSGAFTPRSALWLSPSFGECSLLRDLGPDELYLLLGVLSCLSPNGSFLATPERVAGAVGASPRTARQGLEKLCERPWHGAPLLLCHQAQSGLRFFAPSPHLLDRRRCVIGPAPSGTGRVQAPQLEVRTGWKNTSREEVVAHSRSTYARPRAQVEAEIEAFLDSGRDGRSLSPKAAASQEPVRPDEAATPQVKQWLSLKRALVEVGVPQHRADELLDLYPMVRIERQLEWLPLRQARNPIAYLLAAIERDYAPPSGFAPPKDPPSQDEEDPQELIEGGTHDR